MGDPHFRGHTWQWDRRTRVAEHRPWLRAGCYCWYPPTALLEHPPGHDQTPVSMQVTDFIFSVGSESNLTQIIVFVFPTGSNQA